MIAFLRWQRKRAYLGKSALRFLVILPIYELVLWALAFAYTVQSVLLMLPGPTLQAPTWFTRAIYRQSASRQLGEDSGIY